MGCARRGLAEMGFESFEAKQHQVFSDETMVGGPSFRAGLGGPAAAAGGEDRVVESRHLRCLALVLLGFVWEWRSVMLAPLVVVVGVAAAAIKY